MQFNYVKTSAFAPSIKVADTEYNVQKIKNSIDMAVEKGAHLLALPELCVTGYTAGDLFYSKTLIDGAKNGIIEIAKYSKGKQIIVFVGAPISVDGLLYNTCVVICDGKVLGIVPKSYLPNYSEFFEKRYFVPATDKITYINLDSEYRDIPFTRDVIFTDENNPDFKIAVELCEDLWTPVPPSIFHAIHGAKIIVNLSASNDFSCKPIKRKELVKGHSLKILAGYVYVSAGDGESSTDSVFSGHNMIAEGGEILSESKPFENKFITADIDLDAINYERSKVFNQNFGVNDKEYLTVKFNLDTQHAKVQRKYNKAPFIVEGEEQFLIDIAAHGLKKRVEHVNAQKIVIGISGGLDSTLALIIASRTMQLLGRSTKDIVAITMPCFGTSKRTFDNSIVLSKTFNVTLKKIDITKAVKRHLKDIGHSEDVHDAAYENSQARERTQVLMDYANSVNGLVVGTGDLSELALGWATYNGDHMSMYAVNGSIPKTLVRHLVDYTANNGKGKLKAVLKDILDTPVSPELIPSKDDKIGQVTEDIVGPYDLHDFFLYNIVKRGFTPAKTYFAAVNSFEGQFDSATILKWLKVFVRRFFNQQFKRSCMPDGVKVSEISLSPRGSYKMPSDAISKLWLEELEKI
jgi:NAD+ synthase (glutamine-hydrolysing)